MSKAFFILLISSLAFLSCDPPHYIQFENESDSEVKVTLLADPETENYDFYEFQNLRIGDSVILRIKPKESDMLHFGIGTWSNSEIEELTNSLQKIIIENEDFFRVYRTKKGMNTLLNHDKRGFWWKTEINIRIE
ncbi:hypothetical protein ACFO3O_01600 [Dokdonia ponticola]|uniref:Lipoprotein n=1 Tax=Dokdonia ponticola TaxID=2041041 RepID=A0ABV9HSA6_9FLAO